MSSFSITLYRGSEYIIEKPIYKGGSDKNDFGNGFYCTNDLDLGKEWGATYDGKGYANEYTLDLTGLNIYDLTDKDILVWLSVLLKNRDVAISTPIMAKNNDFIIKKYYPNDIEKADIVIGYRADDSYFSWAKDFIRNDIDLFQLKKAMNLNNLGLQYFIQSQKTFEQLRFVKYHDVEHIGYFNRRKRKEFEANNTYMEIAEMSLSQDSILCSDLPSLDPIGNEGLDTEGR